MPCIALEREYFIAAEEVLWDYAPSGRDGLTGMDFNSSVADMGNMMMGMSAKMWTQQATNRYLENRYFSCYSVAYRLTSRFYIAGSEEFTRR